MWRLYVFFIFSFNFFLAFVGGFLSQFIQGEDLTKSAKAGIFASTVIIKNNGCTWDINTPIKF